MAVSRKAMTEGIRTFLVPGTPCECKFDNPSVTAFRETAVPAPFTQGSRGCSRTSAFVLSSRNISGIVTGGNPRRGSRQCALHSGYRNYRGIATPV